MKKRWLAFLMSAMVAGVLFAGCGRDEKKEEENKKQETEETVKLPSAEEEPEPEEDPRVTPLIIREEIPSEEVEPSRETQTENKEDIQNTEEKSSADPDSSKESPDMPSQQEKTDKPEESKTEEPATSGEKGVPAAVILYEGTYFAEEVYKMAANLGDGIYCEIDISNITDTSFDFTVYEVNVSEETRSMIFKTHTAVFQGDGTTAVYNGKEYTLNFSFPNGHGSLPHVTEIVVEGFAPLEGEVYLNNSVPGHEFG